jgi:hypothetical protein
VILSEMSFALALKPPDENVDIAKERDVFVVIKLVGYFVSTLPVDVFSPKEKQGETA